MPHGKRDKRGLKSRGIQYGALAWRPAEDGSPEILLVTSLDTKRWIIPKGWPMRGKAPHEAAAREAFEEAGIVGVAGTEAVGSYFYDKRMSDGETILCRVDVYPVRVSGLKKNWPEKKRRDQRWFPPEEAASLVEEDDLAALISGFRPG